MDEASNDRVLQLESACRKAARSLEAISYQLKSKNHRFISMQHLTNVASAKIEMIAIELEDLL